MNTGLVSGTYIDSIGRLIGVIQKPARVSKAEMVPPLQQCISMFTDEWMKSRWLISFAEKINQIAEAYPAESKSNACSLTNRPASKSLGRCAAMHSITRITRLARLLGVSFELGRPAGTETSSERQMQVVVGGDSKTGLELAWRRWSFHRDSEYR